MTKVNNNFIIPTKFRKNIFTGNYLVVSIMFPYFAETKQNETNEGTI